MKEKAKNIFAAIGVAVVSIFAITLVIGVIFKSDTGKDKVAVVSIDGVITSSDSVIKKLKKYSKRDDIKAIVLRIDSPGGAVGPSQEIYREVIKLREDKQIITSMGSLAASGGYYIASASHKIMANPGTLTGSIGVIMEFANVEGLFQKIGLKGTVIKSGKFKDTGSPTRPMRADERALLQELIDNVQSQFVQAIVDGRGMDKKELLKVADGRILTGEMAKEKGLVDLLGNLEDAIVEAKNMAGLDEDAPVIYPRKEKGIFQGLEQATKVFNDLNVGFRAMYIMQ